MEPIEVLVVVATIKCHGETWEAVGFWEIPRHHQGWMQLREDVGYSLGNVLNDNGLIGWRTTIKVDGERQRRTGPEAHAMRKLLSQSKPNEVGRWSLCPLAEVSFTTEGKVKIG